MECCSGLSIVETTVIGVQEQLSEEILAETYGTLAILMIVYAFSH